ncbi:CHASE3 domain-containing protein [Bradyrhizobium sp. LHD-71]|uniref:sensor histidine kinase n=1 Tax=Bradyrhizobium sp. LHD-71 TaxID=3072141 RepID=UPI00280FA2B8|nr:CHASE3 domain-containing protein [Bradyrhizobium sp. LHD-71]MDQ8729973.1 CHASE3 domain-containing protein [Bradyrhizobium sp. LHD-71]
MSREHKRPPIVQIALLLAGLLILLGISASSIYLVYSLRQDADKIARTLEVENQIYVALLQVSRAESAERGYLITSQPEFLAEFTEATAAIRPAFDRLKQLTSDNAVQARHLNEALPLVDQRLREFSTVVSFVMNGQEAEANKIVQQNATRRTTTRIREIADAMRSEEDRLLRLRIAETNETQALSAIATTAGSGTVLALAIASLLLVRRSQRLRDDAEESLRKLNANLEAAVEERTKDLQEANEEIQRFAYIVSHDLRSPLVNIMGFTSELEELRGSIFRRIAELSAPEALAATPDSATAEARLVDHDKELVKDFDESLNFIKSSIGKMDRLITAVLTLTREGRREFKPDHIDVHELIEGIVQTVAHQADEANAKILIDPLPDVVSDRLALEQIFSNLIDNALKYLRPDVAGEIRVSGRQKSGYIVYEVADNGRGIDQKDHQRVFDLFRRAGVQDRPGQGIGLAHARALVRRLGGTLSVSSKLGEGSTFTVMLPSRWNLPLEGKTA